MKTVITISKEEVKQAIKDYVFERVRAGYSYELEGITVSFHDKNGSIGYFECDIEGIVVKEGISNADEKN